MKKQMKKKGQEENDGWRAEFRDSKNRCSPDWSCLPTLVQCTLFRLLFCHPSLFWPFLYLSLVPLSSQSTYFFVLRTILKLSSSAVLNLIDSQRTNSVFFYYATKWSTLINSACVLLFRNSNAVLKDAPEWLLRLQPSTELLLFHCLMNNPCI